MTLKTLLHILVLMFLVGCICAMRISLGHESVSLQGYQRRGDEQRARIQQLEAENAKLKAAVDAVQKISDAESSTGFSGGSLDRVPGESRYDRLARENNNLRNALIRIHVCVYPQVMSIMAWDDEVPETRQHRH